MSAPRRDSNPDPLWVQVADLIVEQVERDGMAAGARLPPERELSSTFDVSRVTLRKALNHLVDRGILTASHGRGWFVATPVAGREWPNDLESFTTTARRKHMTPSSVVVRHDVHPADLDVAERLLIPAGTPLMRLERVRLLNDVRIAVDRTTLPLSLAPDLVDVDFTTASLFAELDERGVELLRSVATIEARSADAALAEQLDIAAGAPALVLDQTIFTRDHRPALLSTVEYSGERYRLRTTLQPR